MKLNTRNFGEIEIDDNKILSFPDGIPGFEDLKEYAIIQNPEEDVPFHWLQSVEDTDLAFVIANPFNFKADYDFRIPPSTVDKLKIEGPEDVLIFSIVLIPEDVSKMTANLQAPLIINTKNNRAKQIIIDNEDYPRKFYILEEMKKASKIERQKGAE